MLSENVLHSGASVVRGVYLPGNAASPASVLSKLLASRFQRVPLFVAVPPPANRAVRAGLEGAALGNGSSTIPNSPFEFRDLFFGRAGFASALLNFSKELLFEVLECVAHLRD